MKIVREHLNEEIIGTYSSRRGEGKIIVFKNPPSISRMSAWSRAFHDNFGNFYIADAELESQHDNIDTMHTDLIHFVQSIDSKVKTVWNPSEGYVHGVCWQRFKKTRNFYLSESYDTQQFKPEDLQKIKDYVDLIPRLYEPKDVNFIWEVIDTFQKFKIY